MDDDRYKYCRILVKAANRDALKASLATLLGGSFQRSSLQTGRMFVAVLPNSDAGAAGDDLGDDFVLWPLQIDVDAEESSGTEVVALVSSILTTLWDSGWPAVAACDFEDELPWSGGIQRLEATS